MRFFTTALYLSLKQIISTKFFVITAALSIILVLACGAFFTSQNNGTAVNVGIIYNPSSPAQSGIYKNFAASGNVRVIVFNTRAQLEKSVANAALECGYELNDVDAKLSARDYTNFAALIKSPASTLTGFINELFYTAVIKSISANIARDYLSDAGIKVTLGEIQDKIRAYYNSGGFMETVYVNQDDIAEPGAISFFDAGRVLRGAVALIAFIFIYFSAAHIFGGRSRILSRLGARQQAVDSAARFAAVLVSALLASTNGIIAAAFFIPDITQNPLHEAAFFSLYLLCINCAGYIAASLLGENVVHSVFPVTIIAMMAFGGYFIDLNGISAALGRVQSIFPGAWYQAAAAGSPAALFAGSAVLMGTALITLIKMSFHPWR